MSSETITKLQESIERLLIDGKNVSVELTDAFKKLKESAMRQLARREHSRVELTEKLVQRGFSLGDVQSVLDELVDQGLLSDTRFASSYIRSRMIKGYGPLRIRMELQQKGVTEGLITEVLADHNETWSDLACEAYRKKFGNRPIENYNERAKRMRYMQYKGFDVEHYLTILNEKE